MRRVILCCLLWVITATNVNAWWAYDDPKALFSIKQRRNSTIRVTWQYTNHVLAACNAQNRSIGKEPMSPYTIACAVWEDNNCLIITSKRAQIHTLGHEIRHCFFGTWHP